MTLKINPPRDVHPVYTARLWGRIMGKKIVLTAAVAAIGAILGVVVGYVVYDATTTFVRFNFIGWLTNAYVGDNYDAILWGILGAGVMVVLSSMHRLT